MTKEIKRLIRTLYRTGRLERDEYELLIRNRTPSSARYLARLAARVRRREYGRTVYIRGLIEIGNICKNDCLYCGIRRSSVCERYRLTPEDILECCREGYALGFRTFVLQGGEDPHFTDEVLTELIRRIKSEFPEVALTLSLGERSNESYRALREAGADRYLLRHETASEAHYKELHPSDMSYDGRMRCLRELKSLGYQVGCGFMVGSPYQTERELAEDLKFIEDFAPSMCGIGPFIPAAGTPLAEYGAGSLELTCYLLSIIRLIHPHLLLPATTALGSIHPRGREMGILAGANVVMPNLSPPSVRKKYALYNGKATDGAEAAECLDSLKKRMKKIGYRVVTDRGDARPRVR